MHWYDEVEKVTLFRKLIDNVAPNCENKEEWSNALLKASNEFNINDPEEIAMFIAQTSHECADYNKMEESLYYSAGRLMEVWPSRFPNISIANQYAKNPQALANKTYGGRYGNDGPNDGWLYRGSGPMGLTFKSNYQSFYNDTNIDIVSSPDRVRNDPYIGAMTACWYWSKRVKMGSVRDVTKDINGGTNGLKDRERRFKIAQSVLKGD